jgi:hypothetical protein
MICHHSPDVHPSDGPYVVPPAGDASSGPEVTPGDGLQPWPRRQQGEAWKENSRRKEVGMTATKQAAPQRPGARADRQRHARRMAYLGCAAALGYGVLKLVRSLGSAVGRNGQMPPPPPSLTAPARWFDYWGTPILAGVAVVILHGLGVPVGAT